MKKIKTTLLLFLLGFLKLVYAQDFSEVEEGIQCKGYHFDQKAVQVQQTPFDSLYDAVIIQENTVLEWFESSVFKGDSFSFDVLFLYTTIHKRIKLNNDAGVNEYNKMYLPVRENQELFTIHARAINPDGSVVVFDPSQLKFIPDLDGYGSYYIFAFEGLQLGCEIEYHYTTKTFSEEFYGNQFIQEEVPKLDCSFQMIWPSNFEFTAKIYNGLDSLEAIDFKGAKSGVSLSNQFVSAFQGEPFSLGSSLKQKIAYKLIKKEGVEKNTYSWERAANWYARSIYQYSDVRKEKKERKAIRRFLKRLKIVELENELAKIVRLENYLKLNFRLDSYFLSRDLEEILEQKRYSKFSSVKLFALLLKELGVEHQLVLTGNRFKKHFDPDFETYSSLDQLFLYLPDHQEFLNPSSEMYRLGVIPFGLSDQQGLFIKSISVGGYISAFPETKYIPSKPAESNKDELDMVVTIAKDFSSVQVNMDRITSGHCATTIQPYLPFVTKEQEKDLLSSFYLEISNDVKIEEITTLNDSIFGLQKEKDFTVSAMLTFDGLIEKAGNKYLFRVGDLIGPQTQMYKTEQRKFNIANTYKRSFPREIRVRIPKKYEVMNVGDFSTEVKVAENNEVIAQFISQAVLTEDELVINIQESYHEIYFAKEHYEGFRKVINAAADFNKKVVLLQPKK